MPLVLKLALLTLVILLAIYDCRRGRVPNWVTLPLLLVGLLANFLPALGGWKVELVETRWIELIEIPWVELVETRWIELVEILIACALLFAAWRMGWMGGGDAKLWMALLWLTPVELARLSVLVMFNCLAATGLAQIAWRKLKKQPAFRLRSAGAWRAVPFALWLLVFQS